MWQLSFIFFTLLDLLGVGDCEVGEGTVDEWFGSCGGVGDLCKDGSASLRYMRTIFLK